MRNVHLNATIRDNNLVAAVGIISEKAFEDPTTIITWNLRILNNIILASVGIVFQAFTLFDTRISGNSIGTSGPPREGFGDVFGMGIFIVAINDMSSRFEIASNYQYLRQNGDEARRLSTV